MRSVLGQYVSASATPCRTPSRGSPPRLAYDEKSPPRACSSQLPRSSQPRRIRLVCGRRPRADKAHCRDEHQGESSHPVLGRVLSCVGSRVRRDDADQGSGRLAGQLERAPHPGRSSEASAPRRPPRTMGQATSRWRGRAGRAFGPTATQARSRRWMPHGFTCEMPTAPAMRVRRAPARRSRRRRGSGSRPPSTP